MKKFHHLFLLPVLLVLTGCIEQITTVSLGLDDTYYIARMQKLRLDPALTGSEYEWRVNGEVVSHSRDYVFISDKEGRYDLTFDIIDSDSPISFDFTVIVMHEEVEYSPYIARVIEYRPAPGQFINTMPEYNPGDSYSDMLLKAEECISGTNDVLISLGGYGGYVTFAFDHTVMNLPGQKDFQIWGNAFYESGAESTKGGSAEPGIVMVSFDANCNGLPDDTWYELAGSEYHKPETLHNYTITYSRGHDSKIPWHDSEGQSGHITENPFHEQSYYPQWIDADQLTFTGSRLAPNGTSTGLGRYSLKAYDWGYADNHPNDEAELNSFDLTWAVDSDGNPVYLPGADFIKVYTGVNQECGVLGETSTEISRARDLHLEPVP